MPEAPGTVRDFHDELSANAYLAELQQRLPIAPSAYVPSGKMGAGAVPWMLGGALAGIVPGVLVGVLVGALAALLFGLLCLLVGVIYAIGCIVYITVIGAFLVGAGGLAVTFGLVGLTVSSIVTEAGKKGANRNTTAAGALSVLGSLLAAPLVIAAFYLAAEHVEPDDKVFSLGTYVHMIAGNAWYYWAIWAVCVLGAAGAAWLFALESVEAQKYCERCAKYMTSVSLPMLPLAQADELRDRALKQAQPVGQVHRASQPAEDLGQLLMTPRGELVSADVDLEFFCCDQCADGYFSAFAVAPVTYKNTKGKDEDKRQRWRFVSIATTPEQSRVLQAAKVA